MKPYYYVLQGVTASERHETLEVAITQAEYLARKHPGSCFEILQCVGVTSCSKPSTFWMDGCGPDPVAAAKTEPEPRKFQKGDLVRVKTLGNTRKLFGELDTERVKEGRTFKIRIMVDDGAIGPHDYWYHPDDLELVTPAKP